MARYFNVALCLAAVIVAAAAQFDYFGGYPGGFGAAAPRDPRDNRGPVTFPVTSGGSETSGVRIGASGYGFVPPGSRGGQKLIPLKIHPTPRRKENFRNPKTVENVFAKAELNLRRTQTPFVGIHQQGHQEQVKNALKEAKAILDASLLDAEHKVMVVLKEGKMENWKHM